MYAGRIVEQRPEPRRLRRAGAPLHARPGVGVPGDRRPGLPDEALGPARRPARSARAADGLPVPSRAARAAVDICPSTAGGALAGRPERARGLRARPRLAGVDHERRAPLLEVRDLHVRVPQPPRGARAPSTGSTSRCDERRDRRARGRVGLRQDDARADDRRAAAPGRRARCWCAASRSAHDRRALREHRRTAQLIFQDPTGALNARQTIYEAVAEGVRIQKVPGRRGGARGRGALAGRAAPAGAFLHPLSLRDLGRPAPARGHRRGDGAEPQPAGGRRARLEPRRLGARRDPRPDAAAGARDRRGHPRGHPRPRAGLEHRRPRGRHVPRPDRRGGARPRRS